MAKRQVFFSFEYNKDAWRASQVRNMGKVDNSSTFSDNDWEEVKEKTDAEKNIAKCEKILSSKREMNKIIISELENGKTDVITNITLEKIANALNKKVTDIFFID